MRFPAVYLLATVQDLRYLLWQDLTKIVTGDITGFIQKPIPECDLERERSFTHGRYITLVDAAGRLNTDNRKRSIVFTRGLLLAARMWRIATYHRDESSIDWYNDIPSLMFLTFAFELPGFVRTLADGSMDDVLELEASDQELPDLRELLEQRDHPPQRNNPEEPDLRQQLNDRRRNQNPPEDQPMSNRGKKRKCYNCGKRGHEGSRCTNDHVERPREATSTAGSIPKGCQL